MQFAKKIIPWNTVGYIRNWRGSLEMCKNSKRFLIQTVLHLHWGGAKKLPEEIESCHGWISPVIVGHISWVCELHSETVGKWGEGIEKGIEIHFIAPQAHLPSPGETLSKASAQTLHRWLTETFERFPCWVFNTQMHSLPEGDWATWRALCMQRWERSAQLWDSWVSSNFLELCLFLQMLRDWDFCWTMKCPEHYPDFWDPFNRLWIKDHSFVT